MGFGLADENADVCCSTCNCLGYLRKRGQDGLRPSLTVLADRSFYDFSKSAMQGCRFCDVVEQSFLLLQFVAEEMRVQLLLYPQSPAELHASVNKDVHEVVEIYPCPTNTRHTYPIVGNDVARTSSLGASVHFLREKYQNCIKEHKECRQGLIYLPKRIVDISRTRYRVFEPPVGTKGQYATLSYSWGSRGFAMTTSGNYEDMKHGFDRDKLPVAFQDAAAMAQSLNIRYLWIDTLCIIQDSVTDWKEQAAKMGEIFEGAAITIAASLSTDPYHTLFRTREPMYQEIELCSGDNRELFDVVFKARRKITRGIHAKTGRSADIDPLDKRAWGLQEKKLSTRLISFTGAELQWTCKTLKTCECHPNPYPSHPLFPATAGTPTTNEIVNLSKVWSQIVEEYSTRELKYPGDKFPALSGLARKFGAATGYKYIAGGWKETLLYDLVWQGDFGPTLASSTWRGPSFSWASSPGAVNFRFARHSYPGTRIEHTKLVDFRYDSAGVDPYITALECSLTVQGHTLEALLRRSSQDLQAYTICINGVVYSPNTDQRARCEFSIDACTSHYNANEIPGVPKQLTSGTCDDNASQEREEPITLLSLYSIHHRRHLYHNFLILKRSDHEINTYQRIGIGSGKMYRGKGCGNDFPGEAQLVRPFEWLSIDFERSGRSFRNIVEQVLIIR